jgi:hypothetical protein
MKKSELKALIREVVEEIQGNELNQMIQALENNPEFVNMAHEKYGNQISEQDSSRRDFIKKLAQGLLAVGVAPAAAAQSMSIPSRAALLKKFDQSQEENDALNSKRRPAAEGSTLDIVRKSKNDSTFKQLREKYIGNIDDNETEANKYMKASIIRAAKLLKTANDWEKNKDYLTTNISAITRFTNQQAFDVLYDEPEFHKIVTS